MRRRRLWAGVIGAVIGWGIAGLDGGFADTVDIPSPRTDFVASGIMISPTLGTLPFELARQGPLVRQGYSMANIPTEMVFDRHGSLVTVIGPGGPTVQPMPVAEASLLDPFSRAQHLADAPLHIVRHGVASHLGIQCDRYHATGTRNGQPLRATACVTADGIPLVTAIVTHGETFRTEITAIEFDPPELTIFEPPARLERGAVSSG